mmetsp:Transcript_5300/g.12026  ORF Transcript_5300/g.12026 Transcript_5300/m.12026 type:complete len:618 (-) Transcript_5300:175-2028(-)|eukprot:CAMPEP_0172311956 /NCGR_PEP_ID=MMETSP1058-20130122/16200_1 /TAXON_ID=83371 /ORGANISM="Detonula confervacea, Strain CCMP 353" /LENGTH=617 /DNA_ID=CAMNT_0013025281 /DNA_START=10 /DNA_END=1863 /DNA_ORIENTATION=-
MVSRYCIPEILALGVLVANLQGCTAAAFSCGHTTVWDKSQRNPTLPTVRCSAPTNSGLGHLPTGNVHPLFAKIDGTHEDSATSKVSKRKRVLNMLGLRKMSEAEDGTKSKEEAGPFHVTNIDELNDYYNDEHGRFRKKNGDMDYTAALAALSVKGDTQLIGSVDHKDVIHPVVKMVHERRRQIEKIKQLQSQGNATVTTCNNKRNIHRTLPPDDGFKLALAVEGGGMRGCVTAGMVTAIHHLGLEDTVDAVYGSSAGTVIGAYFITRQLPWFGPELYYDSLTTAGKSFINGKRMLRAVGLGLLDPRLAKDVIFRRNNGKPVLDLNYLLNTTMQENKPLDWEAFEEMQKVQPLKVMASGLKSERAFIMDMEKGSFSNIEEMACCMRASCLLPGVAGPVMNMKSPQPDGKQQYDMKPRNNQEGDDYEPLADALLFEPLPYRAAISEGATHVICLRSRPDGVDVTGKSSVFERMIVRRFLLRKNSLRKAYEYMIKHFHKKLYAEQVLETNAAANDVNRPYSDISKPHVLPIAVPPGSAEVTRLETGREPIFEGVRRGFARCYDALVEDPDQRGKGMEIAKEVFPDDILNYDPVIFTSKTESAYEAYLKDLEKDNREKTKE